MEAKVVVPMVAKVMVPMVVIVGHWVWQIMNAEWRVDSLEWGIMMVKVITREVVEAVVVVSVVSMVAVRLVIQISVVGFCVVSVPERLMVDDMGVMWSEAVVGCSMMERRIGNVWVVGAAMVRAEGNSVGVVGFVEGNVDCLISWDEVPVVREDWCMVGWAVVGSTIWTIQSEMTIVMVAIKAVHIVGNSSIVMDWCMNIVVSIVRSEIMVRIVMVSCVPSCEVVVEVVVWSNMGIVMCIMASKVVVDRSMDIVVSVVSSEVVVGWRWEVNVVCIFLPSDAVIVVVVASMVVVVAWVWGPVSLMVLSVMEWHRVDSMVFREVVVGIVTSEVSVDGMAPKVSVDSMRIVNWSVDRVIPVVAIQVESVSVVIPLSMGSLEVVIGIM